MARRRPAEAPMSPIEGRPFTLSEVTLIRCLITEWNLFSEHPHPSAARLEAIHLEAGHTRTFKAWELDRVIDVDRALAEEVAS